jgi:hypothetical protein
MTIKISRHQSVINRQSDEENSEDHWLKQFERTLQKGAVQPRGGDNLFEQINTIMNGKSKYPSVQAAVDDMMQRSGVTDYINVSATETKGKPKTAQQAAAQPVPNIPTKKVDNDTPTVIKQKPSILRTLENIIKDTHGNMPVPAVISRLHTLHANDVTDEAAWEEDNLIRLVSKFNLQAKANNPTSYENYDNLGQGDHSTADSEIDPSNTDAFNALMPAKL